MGLKEFVQKIGKGKLITAAVVVIVISSFVGYWVWNDSTRDYRYGYIVVAKDKDFEKRYDFPGSGTINDPYLIKDFLIDTELNYGILITETTKYFVIQNCTVTGSIGGIYVHSVARDTCTIRNNTVTVSPNGFGINCEKTHHTVIEENSITAENTSSIIGINIFSSEDSYIGENLISNIEHGIEVWGLSDDTSITANNCTNCDIGIFIDSRNWYDADGGHSVDLTRIEVSGNNCFSNQFGIYFLSSAHNCVISSNNCSFNTIAGIGISNSNDIEIKYNQLLNNTQGITLIEAEAIVLTNNILKANTDYAINATESISLVIYNNNFIDNNYARLLSDGSQAYDNHLVGGPDNQNYWFDSLESEGNYWSELAWNSTAIYDIDGGENSDLYPLELPI